MWLILKMQFEDIHILWFLLEQPKTREWNVFDAYFPWNIGLYGNTGLKLRVCDKYLIFLFLNQNICCGYSKEPSQWDGSFEHPKHMLKLVGKKIFTILRWKFLFIIWKTLVVHICMSLLYHVTYLLTCNWIGQFLENKLFKLFFISLIVFSLVRNRLWVFFKVRLNFLTFLFTWWTLIEWIFKHRFR